MAKNLALGVVIGATLSGGFHTAIGSAKSKFTTLGQEIKGLAGQRGLIERFEADQAALEKARLKLGDVQKQVAALKLALRKNPADEGTAKALAATQVRAEKLSAAVEKQRGVLDRGRAAMSKAGLKVDDLGREYVRLGSAIDETRVRHERLERRMAAKSAAGERLAKLRAGFLGLAGAVYGASKVIGEAMEFESAMADVRKVVDFKEPDGLKNLGNTLKEMSREIPVTASGLAAIAAAGGQLGVAAENLGAFTTTVAKMATAFDMAPEEAGDAMAKLANVYQIPIAEMGKLGDAINHLSDNTAAKARDIVQVLARVGGTARQFGLSAVQVGALGDAFIALGKPPEVAATAINAMLMKMQTATRQNKSFQEGLAAIGVSAEQMEKAIAQDAQGALTSFLEQISKIDAQDRAGILADLFGLEYADDISLLTGSLDQYRKALSLVGNEASYAGSMTREFENRSATTDNQLQLMKNSISVLAVNIGSALLPAVNAILRPVSAFAGWLASLAERFPSVTRMVAGAATGIGGFAVTLGVIAAATWLWNAALLANPIGLVVAGVIGAAAAIITYWEPITDFFKGLWDGIKELFAGGVKFLTKVWENSPLGLLFKAGQKLAGFVGGLFKGGGETMPVGSMAVASATDLPAGAARVRPRGSYSQTSTVNAPITINAAPGMDERQVANEVSRALSEREQQAQARERGALYDFYDD